MLSYRSCNLLPLALSRCEPYHTWKFDVRRKIIDFFDYTSWLEKTNQQRIKKTEDHTCIELQQQQQQQQQQQKQQHFLLSSTIRVFTAINQLTGGANTPALPPTHTWDLQTTGDQIRASVCSQRSYLPDVRNYLGDDKNQRVVQVWWGKVGERENDE